MPNAAMIEAEKTALAARKAAEKTPEQAFADTVAGLNAFAMGASNVAKTNAGSAAVKKFALGVFADHAMMTTYLKLAAATVPGVIANPSLTPEQDADLKALQAARGPAFDALYKARIAATERAVLDVMRAYARSGKKSELTGYAEYYQPWPSRLLDRVQGL